MITRQAIEDAERLCVEMDIQEAEAKHLNEMDEKPGIPCFPDDGSAPNGDKNGHPTLVSVTLARALNRIDVLEFALIRIINHIDNDLPQEAKTVAMQALRERWSRRNP